MMTGRDVAILMALLMASLPNITAQDDSSHWSDNEIDPADWTDGPVLEGSPMDNSTSGNPVVSISVRYAPNLGASEVEGEIILELFPQWVPITVGNFIVLAEENFWDGIFFHRVIDDFVAQSGDPQCKTVGVYPSSSPNCGNGGSGQSIPLEHHDNMSHVDGAIGMARGLEEDSAESQFYICDTPQHGLDPENRDDAGYATFGVVRDGMTHVRAIASVPTSNDPLGGTIRVPPGPDRPAEEVHIISIRMIGVVASTGENQQDDVSTLSESIESIGTGLFTIFFWIWSFAILGGVVWSFKNDMTGMSDSDIESVVDAMLESDN